MPIPAFDVRRGPGAGPRPEPAMTGDLARFAAPAVISFGSLRVPGGG